MLCPRYPPPMHREDEQRRGIADGGRRLLLTGQLRLLDAKKEEVHALRERGGAGSSCVKALANDLAGARFVLSAALLAGGLGKTEREDLERRG